MMDAQLRCQIAFRNVRHLQAFIHLLIPPCPVSLLVARFGWSVADFYLINIHLILDCSQNMCFNLQERNCIWRCDREDWKQGKKECKTWVSIYRNSIWRCDGEDWKGGKKE